MISTILALILSLIFMLFSTLHFYWLLGGRWGLKQAIPTKSAAAVFRPPPFLATLLVALVLLFFGLLYLLNSGLLIWSLPNWIASYGYWFVPSIFILRAIGDFNYVGFFKKVKGTIFAKADSKWFSPLCLGIGIIGFLIQFLEM